MGLDTVELVMEVEEHFGIVLREQDAQRIRTVGDLADAILARILAMSAVPCPTMRAFYETRSTIRTSLGDARLRVRPSSSLRDLIPLSHRRECWNALRTNQSWRFPGLVMSQKAFRLMLMCIAVAYIVPILLLPADAWILSISMSSLFAICVYILINRFRIDIPKQYATVGDLMRTCVSFSSKKTDLKTKDSVLAEVLPIIAEQLGVDLKKIKPESRFVEDLGAD